MIRVWIFQDRDEIFKQREVDPIYPVELAPECLFKDFDVLGDALKFMSLMIEAGFVAAADNHQEGE